MHLFCECLNVREAWFWMRQRLLNFEFLNLMFTPSVMDSEAVWLIGIYVQQVWEHIICKKKNLSQRQIKTECAQQFKNHQGSSRPSLAHIIGIN